MPLPSFRLLAAALPFCLAATAPLAEELRYINPPTIYDASKYYTHVIVTPATGRVAYIAGQTGIDVNSKIVSPDLAGQMDQAFRNLRLALEAAGAKPEQVAKIQVFFVDYKQDYLALLDRHLNALFPKGKLPTSTLLGVQRLARDGLLFEIEAVAHLP